MEDMRIYVASLSDYNNGRLEGKWLDLADYSNASELMEAIQEMLDELTEKYKSVDGEVREEFAVHDYEGIPSTLASEYMGEQDFQQLYDIAEVADERGIPVEVLVERAGDTGSDDYQALADSLMFVVDGNDESDIVHEYEDQIGELGSDFWSNHIYIDDVTERVIYGEDVDRFRQDILSENPDMDEDEAERQAEEMADEEAERREDLTTYLEDMGYVDEIPSFVSKDYEGAWKRSLSYDFDVINHDGQMYVFSSNYSLGGTILSGMIGAYIGYKVGRAKPQKKGFETEKRIGRKVKSALTKKKMAKGGGVYSSDTMYELKVFDGKSNDFLTSVRYRARNQREANELGQDYEYEMHQKYGDYLRFVVSEAKPLMARGGNVNTGRSWHQDRRMHNKSERYEKPLSSRKRKFTKGGGVSKRKRLTKAKLMLNIYKPSGDFFMEKRDDGYIVHFTSRDASKNISHLMDKFDVQDYGKGYHGSAYYIREKEILSKGGGIEKTDNSNLLEVYNLSKQQKAVLKTIIPILNKKGLKLSYGAMVGLTPSVIYDLDYQDGILNIPNEGFDGEYAPTWNDDNFYDAYSFENLLDSEEYAKGGGIGFKALSAKVAKRYEGKKPSAKYRAEYGKRYSKSEAKEVGDKVAGKVYAQQQGRKMAEGGGVSDNQNKRFLDSIDNIYKQRILFNIANHYRITLEEAEDEVTDSESENLYEYITDSTLRMEVYRDMKNRKYAEGGGVDSKRTFSVYELAFGQPYNFYNEEENEFIWSEPTKATLYTKEEALNKREELLKPRRDYYQRTGNNYKEIHIGDLSKKGFTLYAEGGGISGLNDLIRG